MIPQEIIDQILDRLDIVEVVSGYIPLKRAGRNFKSNCPFHNEKSPSFVVSPEKQIYHCFGCSAGGNAIGFVMGYENMTFPEAVEMLAKQVGVELPQYKREDPEKASLATKLYEVNKMAAGFYQNCLKADRGRRALGYLNKRGLSQDTLNEFQVGYAPDAWEELRKFCTTKKVSAALLRQAGLTIPSDKNKSDYDRFRNRIIFPIFNERGNIVAFGGRVLDDSLPKYINSPETVIYSKSNVLYGLNFSKRGIRESGCAVIVEGYTDVIGPYQHGVKNLIATSGTALTERQVSTIKKYTDTAVMLFDADQAGEAASLRGLDIVIEKGMKVRIARLPQGEDPDSFVKKFGKEKFDTAISAAKDLFDYKLDVLVKRFGARDIGSISEEMLPTISKVDNAVVQSDYLRRLAEQLGVHEASLRHELGKVKPDYSYRNETKTVAAAPTKQECRASELHLLGLAICDKGSYRKIEERLGVDKFLDKDIRMVMGVVGELYSGGADDVRPDKIVSRFENNKEVKDVVMKAIRKADVTEDYAKAVEDCMAYVVKENREDELKVLMVRLKKAQQDNDSAGMQEILMKINQIHKEKVA